MNEILNILTSQGVQIGKTCSKSEAHAKGFFHETIHVWFFTKNKKILLQKRASIKKVFPNLWDVSVAGHILYNERIIDAAIRETREEIGLDITKSQLTNIDLRKDEIVHSNGIIDNEFKHIFICELTQDFDELTKQDEEIDELGLFDYSILKDASKHGSFMVPNFEYYYDFIYNYLSEHIF